MHRRGLNIRKTLLRMLFPVMTRMPPRAAARWVHAIGATEYRLVPGLRHRFDRAVAQAARHFNTPWPVTEVARTLAGNQIRWRTRDQLLDGLDEPAFDALFDVDGRHHLDAAAAEGKGIILLGNHFGGHLMPAHWVARKGYDWRLVMERPHHVSRLLRSRFDDDGPLGQKGLFLSRKADPRESACALLRAARVLKAGMLVYMASDVRRVGPQAVSAAFLGHPHGFSATWVALGALSGAPVVPTFCRMRDDGTHRLEFLPPLRIPPEDRDPSRAAGWVARALAQVEERVRLHPENSNDYFFWSEPEDSVVVLRRFDRRRAHHHPTPRAEAAP
jgi:KDO2-lipid IV(A) lauroyltransferase